MSVRDLVRVDHLTCSFRAAVPPLASGHEALDGFIRSLEAYAGMWMPTLVEGLKSRRRKYSRAAVYKVVEETSTKRPGEIDLHFERPSSPQTWLSLFINERPGNALSSILLRVLPFSFFQEPVSAEERSRQLIDLVRAWACWCPPTYAKAHSSADSQTSGDPNTYPDIEVMRKASHDRIYAVYWLNVFGKALVEQVGRERVLSTPAHRVEELPGGSVLLVTHPNIADVTSEASRLAQARALVHLRPDLSFDAVMAQMRERNAMLAPVEPRFDPDTADLFLMLLDHTPLSQRQRKIAEFNARPLPDVSEWLPSASAPPADVEDPAEESLKYHALYAQQLVDALRSKEPKVTQVGPESLSAVEYWTWLHRFPTLERETVEQLLVPAVGAYLGMLLVRHLGGRWVPRRNLDEAQVLLGDRAWLPFLRARHSLQSNESLLDYSLNRFYRTAERHLHAPKRT